MVGVPAVLAVNYYSAIQDITASNATIKTSFFKNQGTLAAGEQNDLGSTGVLPDDRRGDLTAIFVRVREHVFDVGTAAIGTKVGLQAKDLFTIQNLNLTCYVNNVEIIRGPVWAFPHPPMWIQGALTEDTATDTSTFMAQNAGYMLMAISHTIDRQQSVEIVLDSRGVAVTLNSTSLRSSTANTNEVEVVIQVADRKKVA